MMILSKINSTAGNILENLLNNYFTFWVEWKHSSMEISASHSIDDVIIFSLAYP